MPIAAAAPGDPPHLDDMTPAKPKLLFLTSRPPFPLHGGDAIRAFHLLQALSNTFEIHLLALTDGTPDGVLVHHALTAPIGPCATVELHKLSKLRSAFGGFSAWLRGEPIQIGYYRSAALKRRVRDIAPRFDAVVSHLVRMAEYAECLQVPRLLEYTDALSMFYSKLLERKDVPMNLKALVYRFERPRILRCELALAESFDVLSFAGEDDRRWLADRSIAVKAKGITALNGVTSVPWYGPAKPDRSRLVFLGNMRTLQNQDAAFWFAEKVLPRVKKRLPGTRLQIVGHAPEAISRRLRTYDDVDVMGIVEDIAPVLRTALAGLCPIRLGAGIQNKVLDYMNHGLPVVSSLLGVAGLGSIAVPGDTHLQAEEADEWVEAILRLHSDNELRNRLANGGRALVENSFSWQRNLAPVVETLKRHF
ncbi:MAG: glycosyltransferase [Aquincola sp.]|nr:glycosyltransferase [Aquincola sp.]